MDRTVINGLIINAFAAVAWSFYELGVSETLVTVGFMTITLGGLAGAIVLWTDWRRRHRSVATSGRPGKKSDLREFSSGRLYRPLSWRR